MAAGTWCANFGPKAQTYFYFKRARQMGKSLIIANMQWIDFGLMAVSQWTTMPKVVAKQQLNTCPQIISAQRTDSGLMAVLQLTVTLRVVTNG